VRPAVAQLAVLAGELEVYDIVPLEPGVRVRAGDRRQFSVWVRGEGLRYQWVLDGGPVGDRHSWTFAPQETDLGSHLVTVVIEGEEGRTSQTWKVQVDLGNETATTTTLPVPPSPMPSTSTSSTQPPTTSSSTPPSIGLLTTTTTSSSTSTSTSTSTSSSAAPSTSTRAPTTSTTRRSTTTTTARPTTTSLEERPTTTSTTTPPARATGMTEPDIRALFSRYEAAWRNQDIAGLEAVGQIATQGQADALKSYFESVKDLEVTVTIVGITISGDEARVRFVRHDRFRDPAGNVVAKDSPIIEKRVVRTPGGLRLAPPH
jgi:hypothetical protein